MQHLVVDVHLAHLWLHAIALLLLQLLLVLLLLVRLPHLADACGLNKIRQLEDGLLNAALALQELALLRPVQRDRHRVAAALQEHQEARVLRGDVPHLHHLRHATALLELCNLQAAKHLTLLLGEFVGIAIVLVTVRVTLVVLGSLCLLLCVRRLCRRRLLLPALARVHQLLRLHEFLEDLLELGEDGVVLLPFLIPAEVNRRGHILQLHLILVLLGLLLPRRRRRRLLLLLPLPLLIPEGLLVALGGLAPLPALLRRGELLPFRRSLRGHLPCATRATQPGSCP
mmetsp:Transcript_38054/g.98767  ORF Transcript_38054/g.98767 Transcript_38054/m.98767 type:complete len:285 (+) Transcript_38054:1125-1979(+)